MGNILCKETSKPRRQYVKSVNSPIDHVLTNNNTIERQNGQYESNIYPNSITNVNHTGNGKIASPQNFYHSVPNLNVSSITVNAKIFDDGSNRTPVAPPRKKRLSTLSLQQKGATMPANSSANPNAVKNGFKDVFGPLHRSSLNGIDKVDALKEIYPKAESCIDIAHCEARERESKLKIGNRKSDKFFGVGLSDSLSDEPVVVDVTEKTVLRVYSTVESQAEDSQHQKSSNSLDRKAEFLMAMLDGEDEKLYKDQSPIEEPVFVARKRSHKCPCEDKFHVHEKSEEEKARAPEIIEMREKTESTHIYAEIGPKKPERDFTKYRNSMEELESHIEVVKPQVEEIVKTEVERPLRLKKFVSRENLPSPPETPKRKSNVFNQTGSQPSTPTINIQSMEFVTSTPNAIDQAMINRKLATTPPKSPKTPSPRLERNIFYGSSEAENVYDHEISEDNIEHKKIKPFTKADSSNSFLTREIMDKLMNNAYGFDNYHPEDFKDHGHDDGSNLVAPTSKVVNARKISAHRKISTDSCQSEESLPTPKIQIVQNELLFPPQVSPRSKKSSFSDEHSLSSIDEHKCEDSQKQLHLKIPSGNYSSPPAILTPPRSPLLKDLEKSSMNDIIDDLYKKNSEILEEFQSYLEKSIDDHPTLNASLEKSYVERKGNDFIYADTSTDQPRKIKPLSPETPSTPLVKPIDTDDEEDLEESFSDSFESSEQSDNVDDLEKHHYDITKIVNKNLLPKGRTGRRESIEDVDNWFTRHLDREETELQIHGKQGSPPASSGYFTQKIFPFGKTITDRRGSMSDEFFEDIATTKSKQRLNSFMADEDNITIPEEEKKSIKNDSTDISFDHSTLLKYLDSSKCSEASTDSQNSQTSQVTQVPYK